MFEFVQQGFNLEDGTVCTIVWFGCPIATTPSWKAPSSLAVSSNGGMIAWNGLWVWITLRDQLYHRPTPASQALWVRACGLRGPWKSWRNEDQERTKKKTLIVNGLRTTPTAQLCGNPTAQLCGRSAVIVRFSPEFFRLSAEKLLR